MCVYSKVVFSEPSELEGMIFSLEIAELVFWIVLRVGYYFARKLYICIELHSSYSWKLRKVIGNILNFTFS